MFGAEKLIALLGVVAGQGADSPCIDAGNDTAANLGLDARTIGPLSATRTAQGMYQQKYKTYGTFGDLYNAGYLQESTFNVGNGSAYLYGYTYTLTVTSSQSWKCVGVPDDATERRHMVDETGTISWSEDKGKTWTPFGQ